MKNINAAIVKGFLTLVVFLLIQLTFPTQANAQYAGIENDIVKNRKGQLVIKAKPGDKVTVEQLSHDFWFGASIGNGIAGGWSEADKKIYKEKFLENFNSAVTENAVKWLSMEREKGQVNYATIDSILSFTEANNIPLRAHNLFWGIEKFVQPWVKEMDDATLRQTLQTRAETVTAKYKGRFVEYDLNNEMIHGNYYEDRLGPEITKQMAQWARNGDPDIKLFLNDYDILTGKRLDDYMAQIRFLLNQGVLLAGIGVQGHLHTDTFDRAELKRCLDSLAIFNLPIRITEFNMPGQRSQYLSDNPPTMTPAQELQRAKEMADYYRICFAHPAVEGILMWGFWEGNNWIKASSLYKRDWSPTPALETYQNLIFKEWWTKVSGVANKKGEYAVSAFYGKYKVTINGVPKEVNFTGQ
ncbi:MAG: endo-1,4-beta-xylanase [Imperialibacter sp.]|uniref:endo-1,4-beta-xylanase n=1 Tax=Imperialibacter sp. TaxID=2038411 RepID=UPI0032ED85F4